MKEKKLVPRRRFEEFQNADAWEQRKLSELGKVTTGKAFSSADFNEDGEYLVITNKDISDSKRSQNTVTDRINTSDDKLISQYKLNGENILVTMDGVNLGKTGMYSNDKALLAQRVGRIQSDQIEFVYQVTSNPEFLSVMRTLSVGNAIKHISLKQIADYTSFVPTNKEEQAKIGSFFANLDDTITLHQRKLEKTKAMKSAYLAEMFPAEGERVPKRRFAGFTGEWKRRRFNEVIELFSGLTYSPNDVNESGTFVLRSSNVQNGEIVDADNVYVNSEIVNSDNVREGDIIVVVRNGSRSLIGKHAQIKKGMDRTVIGAFMTGIRSCQSNFINALLDTQDFKREVDKNLGATINQITNGMFRDMSFLFPDNKEQQLIGEFFKKLDESINNQQQKLDKLKAIKQAYLEEMFV
ncbi:restriction modification system DNA specificity subunit [Sporosarcina newyorkensis 2681]|uniref:Restriction modification system DNA specificity subunit n=1 Tax=Sporosarcina newyorkensis 2681 TaxID=1027292 RepID=F9DXK7_9BACL|nr:restriction endonuclease subunit S [Sporosarcina newyorkensis]EGQ20515.1 restriction modification system DNA specificity subunit [Sporosarcina newyorkensis 2681]